MDYQVDLDPTHLVIRLTLTAQIVYKEIAEEVYIGLQQVTAQGGPHAAIYDLSAAKDTTIPTDMVRGFARRAPSVPMGRPHVAVGTDPSIYGLARIFQMCREFRRGEKFEVVRTMEEAYKKVEVRPEDFTVCLLPAGGAVLRGVTPLAP